MPFATLTGPRSYSVSGLHFKRGEAREVTPGMADYLTSTGLFTVTDTLLRPRPAARPSASNAKQVLPTKVDPALVEAISQVPLDPDTNFDEDGKPSVSVLADMLGREVTVEERDAAMLQDARQAHPDVPAEAPRGRTRIVRRPTGKADPTTEGAVGV